MNKFRLNHLGRILLASCAAVMMSGAGTWAQDADSESASAGLDQKSKTAAEHRQQRADERRLRSVHKTMSPVEGFETVELFSAMEKGEVEVVVRAKDSTAANIIVTNKTDRPLAIEMPAAFAGVPVMRQAGLGGGGAGGLGGGGLGGGMGGGGLGGGMGGFGQGGQGFGGGMGGGMGGGGFGGGFGGGMGGMGGMGGGGLGGGMFNIPAGATGRVTVTTFCLEHGAPDPDLSKDYTIRPLSVLTTDPAIEQLCHLVANDQLGQRVAQAAAWNIANGLSFEFLLTKNRVERMDGSFERYFTPQQVYAANQVAALVKRQAELETAARRSDTVDTNRRLLEIEGGGR